MSGAACTSCGEKRLKIVQPRPGLSYQCCANCGHCERFDSGQNRSETFAHAQAKYYGDSSILLSEDATVSENETLELRYAILSKHLEPRASVLEVGPGAGHVLRWLVSENYNAVAVEHSQIIAKQLEERYNATVVNGKFESIDLSTSNFDAFCSFHVIEHVTNPQAHLSKALSLVRPGGFAFLATPNSRSLEQILFPSMSPNFDSAHIYVFSPASLRKLSEDAGWEVISTLTPEYSPNWIRVITKLIRRVRGQDEESTAGKYSVFNSIFSKILYFFARYATAPFRFIQSRMGYGNEIFMILRKPL